MTTIGIGIGVPFGGGTTIDWTEYWSTRYPSNLAITVVNDTQVTLNWTNNGTQDYDEISIERSTDGSNYTAVATAAAGATTKNITGLTAYTRYYFRLRYKKSGYYSAYCTPANDWTAWKAVLTKTGTGAGVATIRLRFETTDVVATLDGAGRFYSDSDGTADESTSYTFVAGALRTRYIKVTSGTSNLLIFAKGNWTQFGEPSGAGWAASTNAPSMAFSVAGVSTLLYLRIEGTSTITGAVPAGLIYLRFDSQGISWTYNGAMPAWLTYLMLSGNSIAWTYNGALPTGIITLFLEGNSIAWSYDGALHNGITYLWINGSSINWTGLSVGNTGNIGVFNLYNYRTSKMSSADMVTFLTQLTNRTGSLPATVTINDYADYASPPTEVVNAVNTLKATKGVTTVNLGA